MCGFVFVLTLNGKDKEPKQDIFRTITLLWLLLLELLWTAFSI